MKTDKININGYVEGYYGKLLSWHDRLRIINKLKKLNFNSFFYCPKEDLNHRLTWKKQYSKRWLSSFKKFSKMCENIDINLLVGISPGLDFSFKNYEHDFHILVSKANSLKLNGANKIVLMFDDIPKKINEKDFDREGTLHAKLANSLSKKINENIYVVPRIYSDELIEYKSTYLKDFCSKLNKNINIFYCGKKIIANSNKQSEFSSIKSYTSNKLIFWDNLYANDYCPKRIFLGPLFGRDSLRNIMFNLTGMIETDLFLLDLISLNQYSNDIHINWEKQLAKKDIPKEFFTICEYFFPINFNKKINNNDNFLKEIASLDHLLWKWKTPLSREWYPYLLILKQDLQLKNGALSQKRIDKIFPIPLSNHLNK